MTTSQIVLRHAIGAAQHLRFGSVFHFTLLDSAIYNILSFNILVDHDRHRHWQRRATPSVVHNEWKIRVTLRIRYLSSSMLTNSGM